MIRGYDGQVLGCGNRSGATDAGRSLGVGPVISVDFSPDGKQVISGSWDRTVWLWDVAIGAALQALGVHLGLVHSGSVHSVAFSPQR